MRWSWLVILLMLGVPAQAAEERLADPAEEARAQEIMESLRCLVCQNQSIAESDADLARDLREIVRERVAAGDSAAQVKRFMTDRYGDWILLKPPVKPGTYLLWAAPVLFLLIGALILYFGARARRSGSSDEAEDA